MIDGRRTKIGCRALLMEWYCQGKNRRPRRNTCAIATFSTMNPTCTLLGSNQSLLPFLFLFTSCSSCRLENFVYFTGPHVAQAVLVCMSKLSYSTVLNGICSYIHYYSSLSYFWFITTSFTILPLYAFSVWMYAELPFCSVILTPLIQEIFRYNRQFLSFYSQTLQISQYKGRNVIILWKEVSLH
jgi:hypothetical protein